MVNHSLNAFGMGATMGMGTYFILKCSFGCSTKVSCFFAGISVFIGEIGSVVYMCIRRDEVMEEITQIVQRVGNFALSHHKALKSHDKFLPEFYNIANKRLKEGNEEYNLSVLSKMCEVLADFNKVENQSLDYSKDLNLIIADCTEISREFLQLSTNQDRRDQDPPLSTYIDKISKQLDELEISTRVDGEVTVHEHDNACTIL